MAKQVSHGNPNAAIFILLPQYHGGTDLTVVMEHRRKLEDKLLGCPGPTNKAFGSVRQLTLREVSLSFRDTGHAGDKRKRCQPCGLDGV